MLISNSMMKLTSYKSKIKFFKFFQKCVRNLGRKMKKSDDGVAVVPAVEKPPILPNTKTAVDIGRMVKISSFGEPISPKISCLGQVKHKKKLAKNIHLFLHPKMCPAMASRNKGSLMKPTFFLPESAKIPSNMRNDHIITNGVSKQMPTNKKSSCALSEKWPCLNQMKRFASFHDGEFSDSDWQIAQFKADDYMNEWKCNYFDCEEVEVNIPFSALSIEIGGRVDDLQDLVPRNEVNLWRRRTIDQPTPLQIRSPCASLIVHTSRCP
ncbi:hypothetical protein LIER_42866 [Lithospermum erythrorhizon]|uniref:Uncharacterized protein n=1 Tax=Lithospermum erythrorhizon TaxID=34254 RepID=A0AAV3P2U2_LITER